jgi:hypothetical protein
MGTSSGYKGSNSSSWRIARQRLAELNESDASQDAGTNNQTPLEQQLLPLASALATALAQDNPSATGPALNFSTGSLLPRRGRGGSGGGGGGGASGGGRSGRSGSKSTREVTKGAARGATAIRAAYGLLSGDATELNKLGLNLDELRNLTPRQQSMRIADAVLGDANHPDDFALKRATVEHLKNVLLAEQPPTIEDTVRDFVAEWIFQLGLVELRAENNEQQMTESQIKQSEQKLQRWLKVKVSQMSFPNPQGLTTQQFSNATAKLTADAINLIKAMQQR